MKVKKKKALMAEIPERLHCALKLAAVRQKTTMKAITEKALKTELNMR